MIQANDLWKQYGRHGALKGLNLTVPEGSAFALIGANGAGKTTTIKLLMNILEPTSGSATIFGIDTRRLTPRELSRIGYVSENQELPQTLTLGEYVSYLRPFYPTWDRDLERTILTMFRLPLDRKIAHLSHGMRMKATLTCALCYHPELLILDEPFNGLDPLIRDEFMEGLLHQAGQMTVFMSTHDLSDIESFATDIAFVDSGRLIFQETMDSLRGRFREVHVTMEDPGVMADQTPASWLRVRQSGSVLSFVDSRYSEANLAADLSHIEPSIRHMEANAIDLRTIFTTLARAARDAGDLENGGYA